MAEPIPPPSGMVQLVREKGREYLGVSQPALLIAVVVGTLTAYYNQLQTNGSLMTRIDKLETIVADQSERLSTVEESTKQIPSLATELSTTTRGVDRLLNLQLSRTQ